MEVEANPAEPRADTQISLRPIEQAGEGATVVAVGARNNQVTLQFPHPVEWAALDPQTAVNVAEAMARAAHRVRFGREPPANIDTLAEDIKRRTTDIVREKMINRTVLILRSLQEKGRRLDYQAAEVVDRILQEVT